MFIFDWKSYNDNYTVSESIEVQMTGHALDRAAYRNGKLVGITKHDIEDAVNQAEQKIIAAADKTQTLIIKFHKILNIVGEIIHKGAEYIFRVITVMIKNNFVPSHAWDKVITVDETKMKTFSELIKNETDLSLMKIIERIERKKIKSINLIGKYKVGTKVRFNENLGVVKKISPKLSSILVEFEDNSRIKFFLNKRKNHDNLIQQLKKCS